MIKKLLTLSILLMCGVAFSQVTLIPDSAFEEKLIALGWDTDGVVNGQVLTADISSRTLLNCSSNGISNLTGIQDFTGLTKLYCHANNLSSLDVTNLTSLTLLSCRDNFITGMLDLTNNTALTDVAIQNNLIEGTIDLSAASDLIKFTAYGNQLTFVNIQNGNNTNFAADASFNVQNNPDLTCVQVDDVAYSAANWTKKASSTIFSLDCGSTASLDNFTMVNFVLHSNPIRETLRVTIDEEAQFKLLNVSGQIIKEGVFTTGYNEVGIPELSTGVYFLKMQTAKEFATKRLLKY